MIHMVSLHQVAAQDEGEKEFIFLKERAADVTVEVVGEVIREVAQPTVKMLRLGAAGERR